mgnify:CR=1 FL=1
MTLCFVVDNDRVLLIRKKRGLGAGKMNAPGGKLEKGETPEQGAIRETREEVGVTPEGLEYRGVLRFQFTDGYGLWCAVFVARGWSGELVETDEAVPYWVDITKVPYDEMWADDRLWLPKVLEGETFTGSFVFDGEKMLEQEVFFHGRYAEGRQKKSGTVLVAGCGFCGREIAKLLSQKNWEVLACTRSQESAEVLMGEGFEAKAGDVADARWVREAYGERVGLDAVVLCAAPSGSLVGWSDADRYRRTYYRAAQVLIGELVPRQFLFTSSTSVYGQRDGSEVTELSEVNPEAETGRILRATEQWVVAHGGIVGRLAGIYGATRSRLVRGYVEGTAVLEGNGDRVLNLVHRDDVASAVVHLLEQGEPGEWNVVDDKPMTQRSLYELMALECGGKLPKGGAEEPSRKRGMSHKKVLNGKLRRSGWQLRYPTFGDALKKDPELSQMLRCYEKK